MLYLQLTVAVSAIFCLAALTLMIVRTNRYPSPTVYAKPRGSAAVGIVYAFGVGMMPWEKESASRHLPTYFAGIAYHVGIFTALICLIASTAQFSLHSTLHLFLQLILAIGTVAGLGLLVKRLTKPAIRAISCGDDFVSNLLVDLFMIFGLASSLVPAMKIPFLATAILLFIFIPFSKIRHCFFFFYSRILLGLFYGRRGVLPHPQRES